MSAALQQYYPIENLVLYNTMFPQYARFISLDQKKEALYHIEHDFCDAHHLFSILPRDDEDKFMKYCPICVNEDR